MFIIKIIRNLAKLLRGGASPGQIMLSAVLGVLLGMIPGINLTLLLGVLVFLVFNANFGLVFLTYAIGKGICLLLAPVTFRIGHALIHDIGLEGLFRAAADTPVIALMDLHVYCLVGGLAAGAVLGVAIGWAAVRAVLALRRAFLEAQKRTDKVDKVGQNRAVKLFMRVVFGKQKVAAADGLAEKFPLLRKWGIGLAAIVAVIAVAGELLLAPVIAKSLVVKGLQAAAGAEANVASMKLSVFGGRLEMLNVEVTDADKPTHNMIQIEKLEGDISVRDLLRKRFVIDKLEVSAAAMGTQRQSPGKVYAEAPAPPSEEPQDALSSWLEKTEDIRKYKRYLEKVKDYLDRRRAERERLEQAQTPEQRQREQEYMASMAKRRGYLKLSAQEILTKHPAWIVRELTVDRITVSGGTKTYRLDSRELSSAPELNPNPMKIEVTEAGGMAARVSFDFATVDGLHQVEARVPEVSVGEGLKLSPKAPLDVTAGKADVEANGTFSAQSLHLPVSLDLKELHAKCREGKQVLGMDARTADEVFSSLNGLKITALLEGTVSSPSLKIDEQQVLASMKDALVRAGKAELANRVDKALGEARDRAKQELEKVIPKDIQKVLPKELPGGIEKVIPKNLPGINLLPGKKTEDDEKKDETKTDDAPEKKAGDALKGLLGK